MSTVSTASAKRHALGLPAGSVRATHLLLVVGIVCAVLLIPTERILIIPPYLVYLFFLMIGHYFAHRSVASDDGGAPLHLPRGVIRFLVVVALAGTFGWLLYSNPDRLLQQFTQTLDAMKQQPMLPVYIFGAFFLGVIVRMLLGSQRPVALQDLQAWASILAAVGLGIAVIVHLVIMPSLNEQIPLDTLEAVLGAIVAFYFGERS